MPFFLGATCQKITTKPSKHKQSKVETHRHNAKLLASDIIILGRKYNDIFQTNNTTESGKKHKDIMQTSFTT